MGTISEEVKEAMMWDKVEATLIDKDVSQRILCSIRMWLESFCKDYENHLAEMNVDLFLHDLAVENCNDDLHEITQQEHGEYKLARKLLYYINTESR